MAMLKDPPVVSSIEQVVQVLVTTYNATKGTGKNIITDSCESSRSQNKLSREGGSL